MPGDKPRLLLVSSADVSSSLLGGLAEAGLEVVQCATALEAAAKFVRAPAELVLLAAEDFGDTELDVVRLLRRESPTSFIVLSAPGAERRKLSKALKLGADAYLVEPYYQEELLAILKSALARKRAWLEEKLEAEKEKALARLSIGLAHEINNPLATLSGWLQMLLANEELDPASRQVLQNIREEAERLARVVKDLSILAGHMWTEKTPTELNHLLREVLDDAGLNESTDCQLAQEDLTVAVDVKLAKQALADLLTSSSIRAGGNIRLVSLKQGGRALVSLYPARGNGAALMELFDPFRAFADEGLGEALKLCRSRGIFRSFGGELKVNDQEPGRLAIEIDLPLADWK